MTCSKIAIKCDIINIINLTKNLIQHSRSKHIKIKYHFIRDYDQNNDVVLKFILIKN